ncbi:uncharacterized protein [Watersipora subatra]|uniref:uncharacterized protein n=1 Tax=Watersipora subatra TaxID=2589382 RepID=UPI00355BD4E4
MTCVHHAAFHGFTEVLNELLGSASSQEKYELLSLEDDKGNIPLGGAVVGQHYKTVCAILSALEDVCRHKILSLLNDSKKTVLHIAAFKGFTDIADVLLASVSREEQLDLLFVHGSSSDVNTPIIEAIMQGHVDTFKHLMDLVDPSDRLRALLMHNHEGLLAPYTALTFGYSSMEQNILESLPDADRPHLAEQMHAKNTELPTEDANDSNVFTAGGIHSSDQVEKQIFKSVSDFHGETERSVPQIFECKPNIAVYETEEEEAAKRQIAGQITSVSETNPETSNGRLVRHNSSSFPVAWSSTYKQTIHDRSQTSDSPQQMDSDFSLFQESTACGGPQEERTVYELPMTSQQPEIEDSNAPTLPEDLQKDVQKKINIDLIMKYIFQPLNVLDSTSLYLTGKEASFQSPKKHVTPEVLIPFNMFSLEIGKHVKFEMFLTQSVEILNEFLIGRLRTKKQNCQCLNSNLHEIDPQILNKETSTPVDSRDNGLEADNPEESSDKPQKISQHQNSEQPEEEANKVTASLVHTSSENDSGSSDQGIADDVSSPSNPTALENCRNRPVQVNRDDQASLQCEGASASCLPAEGSEQHEKFRELTQAAGGRSQYTSESSKPGGDNKVLVDYSKWPQLRSMLMKIMEEHEIRAGTFDEDDGEIAVLMTDIEIKKQAVKEMKSAAQSYGYTLFAEELRCKGEELSLADLFKFALGNQKSDVEEFVFGTFDNPSSRLITKVRIIMQAKSRRDYNADKLRYFLLTPCHGLLSTEERQYKIEKPQDVEKHQEKMKKCVFKTFFDARHCMWVGSKANTLENEPRSVYRFLRARNEDFPGYASLLHDAMLIELERSEAKEIISYFKTRKTNPHLNSPEAGTSAEAVTCAGAVASAGSTSSIPKFEGDDVEIVPIDSRDELESLSLARHKISCNGKFGNLCPIPGFSYYYYVFGDHLLFQLDDGQTLEGGDCGALVYLEDGDGPKKKVLGQFIGEKESNSKRFPKYMAIALHWNLMHILKQKSSYLEDLQIALFWDPHIENVRVAAANQGNSLTAFPTNGDSGIGPSKGV